MECRSELSVKKTFSLRANVFLSCRSNIWGSLKTWHQSALSFKKFADQTVWVAWTRKRSFLGGVSRWEFPLKTPRHSTLVGKLLPRLHVLLSHQTFSPFFPPVVSSSTPNKCRVNSALLERHSHTEKSEQSKQQPCGVLMLMKGRSGRGLHLGARGSDTAAQRTIGKDFKSKFTFFFWLDFWFMYLKNGRVTVWLFFNKPQKRKQDKVNQIQ